VADTSKKIGRRDMLTSVAVGVAGAVAAPGAAGSGTSPQAAPSSGTTEQALPRLLDDHQRAVLARLADQILPGSRAAGVPDLLDRVLTVEPAQAQRRFLNALGAFEREARDRHGKGWIEIAETEQLEILRAASVLASAWPAPPPWTRGQPVERPATSVPPANLRDHFDHLKDWIQRAYVTTAPAMTELGFTGRMAFPSFPGCQHSGNDHA
jgi:hypothetical protein